MSKIKVALGLSGGVDPDNTLTGSRGLRPRVARARLRGKFRVALGLSGGVDSAVAAYLLIKHGFDVSCVYLNCFDGDTPGCRGDNDRKDALAVAMQLGLPFQVLDYRREYQAAVIDYFKKEYLLGRTPNPDVVCNRDIKFGLFLDWAIKAGFDYVATGHYAKIERNDYDGKDGLDGKDGYRVDNNPNTLNTLNHLLLRPKDLHKDQTYFLWAVPKEKFSSVLFPLGNLLKTEVRGIALKIGLPVAKKKDSTGICFVGEVRVEDFLKSLGVREKEGEVVVREKMVKMVKMVKDGNNLNNLNPPNHYRYQVIGSHRGVWFYTIGQRHGFEIFNFQFSNSKQSDRPPLYVIEKDVKNNRLIVGFGAECYRDSFEVSDCNWLAPEKARPCGAGPGLNKFVCLVRIRHGGELIPCSVISSRSSVFSSKSVGYQSAGLKPMNRKQVNQNPTTDNRKPITIHLSSPQRGVAPGQSAVFYSEEGIVLGGGVIQPQKVGPFVADSD